MIKFIFNFFTILLLVFTIINNKKLIAANPNHAIPLNSSQNPWRSIGVLENNNKKCTAIVVGNNLLLTSAYCLIDENGNKINSTQQLLFKAGYKNGFYLVKTTINSFLMPKIIYPPNNINDTKNSWAFLFTTKNISDITGTMRIYKEPITSKYIKNHKIITVGYTGKEDNGLFASIKCEFNKSDINFNDKSFVDTQSSPILLQICSDYFSPLIGSPVIAIDKENNASIIGIISAKLTKNTKDNTNMAIPQSVNVVIPMTYLNNQDSKSSLENYQNNDDLEKALRNTP